MRVVAIVLVCLAAYVVLAVVIGTFIGIHARPARQQERKRQRVRLVKETDPQPEHQVVRTSSRWR